MGPDTPPFRIVRRPLGGLERIATDSRASKVIQGLKTIKRRGGE